MGVTAEALPARTLGMRSSSLKRPLGLLQGGCRLTVGPDGGVRSLFSLQERRALFGVERLSFFKVQAGVVVPAPPPDWVLRPSPRAIQLAGRVFDAVDVSQTIEFHPGQARGFQRRVKLRNGSPSQIRLRALALSDPTAAHFERASNVWGSLGVNAFNRESHVAMDEVSDPPSARVVGAVPSPSRFYMTGNTSRALEALSSGDLPDGTAGMSGQALILSLHEIDLSPGEAKQITFVSIYSPGKLEEALSEFGKVQSGGVQQQRPGPLIASSDRAVTEAAAWAIPAAAVGAYLDEPLERYEVLGALACFDPAGTLRSMASVKSDMRKDGSLPHSLDPTEPGVLETAVFLKGAANHLLLAQDKKLARSYYPVVKKLAGFLLTSSRDFTVASDPSLPQGWRRKLGSGYPSGEVPELSLAVAGALSSVSQLSKFLSKSDDAARYRERAEMITDKVRKKLVDERGLLLLCRDSSGRARADDTIDMAVAAYRHPFMASAEQGAAHRLLEKDFDTPFGPRCVPTSNQVYFNGSYGMGQLGGVWTRAALANAAMCYEAGLTGVGSLGLGKVARLVTDDAPRLGGSPGDFPLWVDVEGKAAHGEESDPVAAARFLEVLLRGELGVAVGPEGGSISPAEVSALDWLVAIDVWAGEPFTAFLGRAGGKAHLFYSGKVSSKYGTRLAKAERVELAAKGVFAVTFYSPGQIICVGNNTPSAVKTVVGFPPRGADLSRRLSTPLEEYDPTKGSWGKAGSIRVSPTMSFEASIPADGWKAYRVSTG